MRRRWRLAAALRSVGSGGLDLDTRAPVMVPLFQKPKCGSSIDASSPGKRDKQNRLDAIPGVAGVRDSSSDPGA